MQLVGVVSSFMSARTHVGINKMAATLGQKNELKFPNFLTHLVQKNVTVARSYKGVAKYVVLEIIHMLILIIMLLR